MIKSNRRKGQSAFVIAVIAAMAGCGSDGTSSAHGGDGLPDATAGRDGAVGADGGPIGDDTSPPGDDSGSPSGDSGSPRGDAAAEGGAYAYVPPGPDDVTMMHKHPSRDGLFVDSALTKAALMGKTLKVDATFAAGTAKSIVQGAMYASPLYVANGPGGKGTFYVATEQNNVYAIDETTGAKVWTASAGPYAQNSGAGCGNVHPLGITGTPAIDLGSRLIVFDASTADTQGGSVTKHTIHAWSIDDGHEVWKLDVGTLSDSSAGAFKTQPENQRSAVLVVGGIAYVTYGGHWGDCGSYHGWIVGVPLAGGPSMAKEWATPAAESGMWAAGGPSSDGTSIYMATGNGDNGGGTNWKGAFSVIRFGAGPTFSGNTSDWFLATADTGDEDLGGSAPLVVDAPAITPSKLIVQFGKDSNAYVLNRDNLGGRMSPVYQKPVMSGEISNVPAWATTAAGTFVAMVANGSGKGVGCGTGSGNLTVMKLDANAAITVPWCADNKGGGSPSITSSDGTHDMLVWTFGTDVSGGAGSGQIHAWDLETGAAVVTGSDTVANTHHFTTPIFVHGRAFVGADDALVALKP